MRARALVMKGPRHMELRELPVPEALKSSPTLFIFRYRKFPPEHNQNRSEELKVLKLQGNGEAITTSAG
jgi:hypothetical protein